MDLPTRFLDWLRAERGASPHTLRAYGAELRRLAERLAPRSLLDATVTDLRSHLARGASAASSLQRRIASLRTFGPFPQEGTNVVLAVGRTSAHGATADAFFTNARGDVVLVARGCDFTVDASLAQAFVRGGAAAAFSAVPQAPA